MSYQQITRAQLRTRVIERLGALGPTFYRSDELNRYIQEGLRMWNLLTGYWKTRALLTTPVSPSPWFMLPGTITSNMRVAFNQSPLSPTSIHAMDMGRGAWESETTATGGDVPTTPAVWAVGSVNMIAIWPTDAVGGNSLELDGIASTPILSTDASFVDIGQDELNQLLDFIEHIALFKEGGQEFQQSQALFQSFLRGASTRNALMMASAKFRTWMGLDQDFPRRPRKVTPERVGVR